MTRWTWTHAADLNSAEGGSSGAYPTRERAIEIVGSVTGDMLCCAGHLATDSDL